MTAKINILQAWRRRASGIQIRGNHLAAVNTVLEADQVSEARELAREVVAGLESGKLEPTAGSLEPLADQPR